jgi:two-component system response regulator FixJ
MNHNNHQNKNRPSLQWMMRSASTLSPVIHVVEDKQAQLGIPIAAIRGMGLAVECYSSPELLLREPRPLRLGCVLLNVSAKLHGASSFDWISRIDACGSFPPVVVWMRVANVRHVVRAFQAGAVDCLVEPYTEHEFLKAIYGAINQHAQRLGLLQPFRTQGESPKRLIPQTLNTSRFIVELAP